MRTYDTSPVTLHRLWQENQQLRVDVMRLWKRLSQISGMVGLSPGDQLGTLFPAFQGGGTLAETCRYYWEWFIENGTSSPTSGTAVYPLVIDGDSQNVTLTYNMTAAQLKTEILTQFSGLDTEDVDCEGGPLPDIPIDSRWNTAGKMPVWPPTVGAQTFNNGARAKIRQRNPDARS